MSVFISVQNSKLHQLQMTVWLPVLYENGTVDIHTCIHPYIDTYIHTPFLKKLCKIVFLLELRQISSNYDIFLQKDGKQANVLWRALICDLT